LKIVKSELERDGICAFPDARKELDAWDRREIRGRQLVARQERLDGQEALHPS
jgi:hypothetical protein